MTTNINLFVSEEIMEKNCPWPQQGSQVLHLIEVENHDASQSPHLRIKVSYMQGRLLELASKDLHKRFKLIFSLIIMQRGIRSHRMNL